MSEKRAQNDSNMEPEIIKNRTFETHQNTDAKRVPKHYQKDPRSTLNQVALFLAKNTYWLNFDDFDVISMFFGSRNSILGFILL